jgi:serine phosphatase RsbU (regulator of sigma subunit)
VPFGIMEDASYEELAAQFEYGDCLLMFSDGAFEIHNAQAKMLNSSPQQGKCIKQRHYTPTPRP